MRDPLAHVPAVVYAPPPRCYSRGANSAGPICGELAGWQRPGVHVFDTEFFCEVHRGPADVGIAAEHVFRRVTFVAKVFLAGASPNDALAKLEGLARLEAAVKAIGGVLDVVEVHSSVVKSCPQPPTRRAFAEPDSRD